MAFEPLPNIRSAVIEDAPALQVFAATLVAERLPVLFEREHARSVDETRQMIERLMQTPRCLLLVAESGSEIVGMLDCHGHAKPQRSHGGEFGITVSRAWWGRGVGTRLLQQLIKWATSENLRRIELSVFSNNAPAIALYERHGFVHEGTQRQAVRVGTDFIDLIGMAKVW